MNVDSKSAGVVYYRLNTISSKIALVNSVIRLVASPENLKIWKEQKKLLDDDLIPVRNVIVHHPLLQETSSDEHQRMRYKFSIRVEPYEVEAGQRAPRSIDAKSLREHGKQVDQVTHRLTSLIPKIAADAKGRAKHSLDE